VQLLRRRAKEKKLETPELVESLGVMELAARDGAETVRRLRQFSHGDEARASGAIELREALEAAAEFTSPRWKDDALREGRRITVSIQCEAGLHVVAPGSELREVFTNLILNAVDALQKGGTIRLSTRSQEGRAIAVVADDGVGMSADTRRRVFDPFFTTKGPRGTGLGLSVVYGIVERLGGTLSIDSEPGEGTQVIVSLPLAATPARPRPVVDDEPAPQRSDQVATLDVLVVDDEAAVRDLLGEICETLGHRPVRFESAREALDKAGADAVIAKPFSIEDIDRITHLTRRPPRDRAA
jgi:signal transduction histidine kinase